MTELTIVSNNELDAIGLRQDRAGHFKLFAELNASAEKNGSCLVCWAVGMPAPSMAYPAAGNRCSSRTWGYTLRRVGNGTGIKSSRGLFSTCA